MVVVADDPEPLDDTNSGVILDFLVFKVRGGLNKRWVVRWATGLFKVLVLSRGKGIANGGSGAAPWVGVSLRGGVSAWRCDGEEAALGAS
jgi:hypothetical protein